MRIFYMRKESVSKRKSRFMLNISIARSEHKYSIAVKVLFVKGTWTVDEMTFPGGCYFLNQLCTSVVVREMNQFLKNNQEKRFVWEILSFWYRNQWFELYKVWYLTYTYLYFPSYGQHLHCRELFFCSSFTVLCIQIWIERFLDDLLYKGLCCSPLSPPLYIF